MNRIAFQKREYVSRESNIELMRLICMFMILVHHVICHCVYSVDILYNREGETSNVLLFHMFVNSLCYVGVNCFILISGYFGIKFKLKGLLSLYFTCIFYSIIRHYIACCYEQIPFTFECIKNSIFVFSHNNYWWFVNCYFVLYLLSPLLNKALNCFSKKEYHVILCLLIFLNIYMGFVWGKYNQNGYTVPQFIFVYTIGRYIGKYVSHDWINSKRNFSFILYISCVFIFWLIASVDRVQSVPFWRSLPYNNPFLIVGAIELLLFMLSFHFKSNAINIIASSAFSIYLLQDISLMKQQIGSMIEYFDPEPNHSLTYGGGILLITVVYAIIFILISIIIDQIRKLSYIPIRQLAYKFLEKLDNYYFTFKQ